ncbi:hypothetical protein BH23PLA1_BH23PLA1_24560 [soil metagenome]
MAKKRASKSSKAESTAPPHDAAEAMVDRASIVAQSVQIKEIFAEEYQASRLPAGFDTADNINVKMNVGRIEIGFPDDRETDLEFSVRVLFSLQARTKGSDADSPPVVAIECGFVLIYAVPSFEELDDEGLKAFARTSGVFNAWPYWREFVQSACTRLAVPTLRVPTFRLPSK